MDISETAKQFAAKAHAAQWYGERSFIYHPEQVAEQAKHFGLSAEVQAAAWLHDTLEDTRTTEADLRAIFPAEVVDLVVAVTDAPGVNRRERFARTFPKLYANRLAVALKLCDRIANIRDAKLTNKGLFQMYRKDSPSFAKLQLPGEWCALWETLNMLLMF